MGSRREGKKGGRAEKKRAEEVREGWREQGSPGIVYNVVCGKAPYPFVLKMKKVLL